MKVEYVDPKKSTYIATVMSLAQEIDSMNATVDDEYLGVLLLSGLSESYEPMIMALDKSNSELVRSGLLADDIRKDCDKESAFYTNKPMKKNIEKQFFKYKCDKCNKKGHKRSKCRSGKKPDDDQEDSFGKPKGSSNKKTSKP